MVRVAPAVSFGIGLALVIICIMLAIYVARNGSNPVQLVQKQLESLVLGQIPESVQINTGDEIE